MASFDVKVTGDLLELSFQAGDVKSQIKAPFEFLAKFLKIQSFPEYRELLESSFGDLEIQEYPHLSALLYEDTDVGFGDAGEVNFLGAGNFVLAVSYYEYPALCFNFRENDEAQPYGETLVFVPSHSKIPVLIKTMAHQQGVFCDEVTSSSSQPLASRFCLLRIGKRGYSSDDYVPISSFEEGLDLVKGGLLFKLVSVLGETL